MRTLRAQVVFAVGLVVTCCAAASWAGPADEIEVAMVEKAPALKGDVLADRMWKGAEFQGGFTLLGKGTPTTQQTRAAVLCDGKFLYAAFLCDEADMGKLVTRVKAHDGPVYADDCVELFVAPAEARPEAYYHFVINSDGVLRDEFQQDAKWESGAKTAAFRGEKGWSAQIAIPLGSLGIDALTTETWRVNFCREQQALGEVSSWAPCKAGFHEPESFGKLAGMKVDYGAWAREAVKGMVSTGLREVSALTASIASPPAPLRRPAVVEGEGRTATALGQTRIGRRIRGEAASQKAALQTLSDRLATGEGGMAGLREMQAQAEGARATLAGLEGQLPKARLEAAAGERGYVVCPESPMNKVRYDQPYNGAPGTGISLTLAKNEYEAEQAVVVPVQRELHGVTCAVSDLSGPKGARIPAQEITVNVVGYAKIEKPSGGAKLPKGMIPDPLLPNAPVDIKADELRSFWITVHTATDQAAGQYRGKVTISPQNAKATQLDLNVKVWNFALPVASRLKNDWQITWGSVWPRHDLVAAPGVPKGWTGGMWTGSDVTGVVNYFGQADFRAAFDTQTKHKGGRSLKVTSTAITPGTVEAPRWAWYTEPLKLRANTQYELTFWYRTEGMKEPGVSAFDGLGQGAGFPLAEGEWKQARWVVDSKQGEMRVYLKVDKMGTAWVDDARLAPAGAGPEVNELPNPDFEQGRDADREQIARAYRLNSLQHRCSDQNIGAPEIKVDAAGLVTMDWTKFDEAATFYIAHGQNAFNISWAELPSGWGTVETVDDQKRIARCKAILRQTQAHLEEKGWLKYAYIYTIDEPGKAAFPQVKQAFGLVHEVAPKLKCLLTYGYGASKPIEPGNPVYKDLAGFVDIHVPHSDCFEPIYLKERQKAGDEIWAYVCISAQNPYLNCWGIDYPGIEQRMLYWQLYQHDITGFLYWATTYWTVDPWKDPLTYPGGNSDGSMIYPGETGPVNSIRWELTRDGIEDYDMMTLLAEKATALEKAGNAKAAGQCRRALDLRLVTTDWTKYTDDPGILMMQRQAIGDALERQEIR